MVKLQYNGRVLRGWDIGADARISAVADPDYIPRQIVKNRKGKAYTYVFLVHESRLRWLALHRLMAFSWLGPPPLLRNIVDHRDGNSLNNNVQNLRWLTVGGNNLNRVPANGTVYLPETAKYAPRIAGFVHKRYQFPTKEDCQWFRKLLVEAYVRFTMRFPERGNDYPHTIIYRYLNK